MSSEIEADIKYVEGEIVHVQKLLTDVVKTQADFELDAETLLKNLKNLNAQKVILKAQAALEEQNNPGRPFPPNTPT